VAAGDVNSVVSQIFGSSGIIQVHLCGCVTALLHVFCFITCFDTEEQ
jgi:hypothetical protein